MPRDVKSRRAKASLPPPSPPPRQASGPAARVVTPRLARWRAGMQQMLDHPLDSMGRMQRLWARNLRVIILVARIEVYDRLKLHAQALTYDTLLALIPLLAVIFAAVRGFGGMRDVGGRLEELILSNLSGSAEMRAMVGKHLSSFVANIQTGEIGSVSIVILVFSVMSLLGHIEFAFNTIFGSKTQRPLVTRLLTYWAVLTLGPVLLAASFAMTAALQSSFFAASIGALGPVKRLALSSMPWATTWLAFTTMYLVVPHTRVRLGSAIPAAIIAGTGWQAAKVGYAVYAKNAITLQNIYGSLAAIPLFILWLYVSWLLVLFGAQLAFAFQHSATYRREDDRVDISPALREHGACRLLLEVARDFYAGRPPTDPDHAGHRLGLPRRLLLSLVDDLHRGGFIQEIEATGGLVPAADLAHISVEDIVRFLRHGTDAPPVLAPDDANAFLKTLFAQIEETRWGITGAVTFRDLAARFEDATAAGTAGTAGTAETAGTTQDKARRQAAAKRSPADQTATPQDNPYHRPHDDDG